jgi:hypothetical protein
MNKIILLACIFARLTKQRFSKQVLQKIILYSLSSDAPLGYCNLMEDLKISICVKRTIKTLDEVLVYDIEKNNSYFAPNFMGSRSTKSLVDEYKNILQKCKCCKKHSRKTNLLPYCEPIQLERQNAFRRFPNYCRCACRFYYLELLQI